MCPGLGAAPDPLRIPKKNEIDFCGGGGYSYAYLGRRGGGSMAKKSMKQYYGITFVIGLGFFTMGLMDPLYDTYVPMFLANFLAKDSLIGLIMGVDNMFALALIPIVSALSDKTRTPIGRRMPYIIVTLPLTAVFFGMLPGAALKSLAFLIVVIFFLNVFKQAARGPVVALMPDIIPGEFRSEANGVINTMGGIAAITGTVVLARLYDVSVVLPVFGDTLVPVPGGRNPYIGSLPFLISAVLVLLATVLLFAFVRERSVARSGGAAKAGAAGGPGAGRSAAKAGAPSGPGTAGGDNGAASGAGEGGPEHEAERLPVLKSLKLILGAKEKSALYILIALLLWFIGYQGVLPWIGLYGVEFLGLKPGTSALSAGMVGIAYALFAIPSGVIAHRIGRKKTIRGSLIGLTVLTFLLYLHYPVTIGMGLSHTATFLSFWALLFLFGIFWVSVVTNSFPMLWQMATFANMGIYTGLYYFFSQGAGIIAPGITGGLRDIFGARIIFLAASLCMLAAFFVMGLVRKGETTDSAIDVGSAE
ncbi:MAG: MFS transporter [Spirochaetaceae bacterium]|nr:MFS transporter [Spirochaetaceae bacterium]